MKIIFLLILTTIIFYGCSSTYTIKYNYSAYKELNDNLEGEECEITLTNGDIYEGRNIIVMSDSIIMWNNLDATKNIITKPTALIHDIIYSDKSKKECKITLTNGDVYVGENIEIGLDFTSWYELNEKNKKIVKSKSEIHKIMYIDRSSAMEKGFAFGLLIGGGLGYLVGAQNESGGSGGSGYGPNISGGETAVGAIIGSLSGIILGVSYGAIRGDREIYILNPLIDFYPTPIIPIAPTKIEKEEGKIRLLEIKKIINETEKYITVLWGFKKIKISKSDILDINKNNDEIAIKMTGENYEQYFKQKR